MIKIENGIEYLDYDQAATEYNLSRSSIPPMVSRGTFTSKKFPNNATKYISRDQLEAYKNRKEGTSNTSTPEVNAQSENKKPETISFGSFSIPRDTAEYVHQNKLSIDMVQNPSGGMSFPFAQSDEADSKNAEYNISFSEAFAILVGLLALFFALRTAPKQQELEEARDQAERELQEIGLQKEKLESHRNRTIVELQRHPKRARRIQKIVENAVLLDAM